MRRDSVSTRIAGRNGRGSRLDMNKFAAESLDTGPGLQNALAHLEDVCFNTNVGDVISCILEKPKLFEFILSSTENCALDRYLLDSFPANSVAFGDSVFPNVLQTLCISTLALTPDEHVLTLQNSRLQAVQLTLPILNAISQAEFRSEREIEHAVPTSPTSPTRKRFSQRAKKQARRTTQGPHLDVKHFQIYERHIRSIPIPTTCEEAVELETSLLRDLKEILKTYIDMLRDTQHYEVIKESFIRPVGAADPSQDEDHDVTQNSDQQPTETPNETANETTWADPAVQKMQAALYCDSPQDFGEWQILLASSAANDLRKRRKDGKIFEIILRKLRDLSHGHFSNDNQKRLNGPSNEVPIYEAKMTGDTRLIYQVDCIPKWGSEGESIRVFGIYTHAQMDGNRLWSQIGSHLSEKRGAEYRRRCLSRKRPANARSTPNVYTPDAWPSIAQCSSDAGPQFSLPPADLASIHDLLVLEKYISFSQVLLDGILADKNLSHIFNLSAQENAVIFHTSSSYVIGRSGTGKTTTMLFKMIGLERSSAQFHRSSTKIRQVFVTRSKILTERVDDFFRKLLTSVSLVPQSYAQLRTESRPRRMLTDIGDDHTRKSHLPERYSELADEHFPLFVTFDHLIELLEADMFVQGRAYDQRGVGSSSLPFRIFRNHYWPHFPQDLTAGLDPTLVFNEILGIIEGSGQVVMSGQRFLDKHSYKSLSQRSYSSLAGERDRIYGIFERYLKIKSLRKEHDAADRTYVVLQSLQENGLKGTMIDYLYVDEVQDNLLIDTLLLRSVCNNPHGLFWAGDTAQTISAGSLFRFQDLKHYMYTVEASQHGSNVQPTTFHLTTNYRSHGGIINCADAIVELLYKFWPYSVDRLRKEVGIVDGVKPVFFSGWEYNSMDLQHFLFGERENTIEFGTRQCWYFRTTHHFLSLMFIRGILVRDDEARTQLETHVGTNGIIFTLYESKGLEFDDVLLYDFFDDAVMDASRWRVVLNGIKPESSTFRAPAFNEVRHAAVCSELKFLYVAVTRARKNLWIIEHSLSGEPMKCFWDSKGLIQICKPGMEVPHIAVDDSTQQDWQDQGWEYFNLRKFAAAMQCFRNAKLPLETAVAKAYHLRDKANMTFDDGFDARNDFITAGRAFLECAQMPQSQESLEHFCLAGECFAKGGHHGSAASAYLQAKEFTLSAQQYRDAGLFDDVVKVIRDHTDEVDAEIADKLLNVARFHYLHRKELGKAKSLFKTVEDELEFAEENELDDARTEVLKSDGRFVDAAEAHLGEGQYLKALDIMQQIHLEDKAVFGKKMAHLVLKGLWQLVPLMSVPLHQDKTQHAFVEVAQQLDKVAMAEMDRTELSVLVAIASNDIQSLIRQRHSLQAHRRHAHLLVLALDRVFDDTSFIKDASSEDLPRILETFLAYAQSLRELAFVQQPQSDIRIQKLLGMGATDCSDVKLWARSHIREFLTNQGFIFDDPFSERIIVQGSHISTAIKNILLDRLCNRVLAESEAWLKTRFSDPCFHHLIYDHCGHEHCARDHLTKSGLTEGWYNKRLRVYLLQVSIFQTLDSTLERNDQLRQRRFLLSRLFDAVNPIYFGLGSSSQLQRQFDIGEGEALCYAKELLKDDIYSLKTAYRGFLTSFTQASMLAFDLDDQHSDYIWSTPCNNIEFPPVLLMSERGFYIVHDLLSFFSGSEYGLVRGISFLGHVIEKRPEIQMDANTFIHLIERICGSVAFARKRFHGSLHNLMLPRSWLRRLLKSINVMRCNIGHVRRLSTKLMELMRDFAWQSERDFMHFRGKMPIYPPFKWLFLTRICTALCLIGYNVNNYELRQEIWLAITSLPRINYVPLYCDYVRARRWSDLAAAVRHAASGVPLDGMIHLMEARSMRGPFLAYPGTTLVVYKEMSDIPKQLGFDEEFGHVPEPQSSQTSSDTSVTQAEMASVEEASIYDSDEDQEIEHAEDASENRDGARDTWEDNVPINSRPDPTEAEHNAARIIQDVYRRTILKWRQPEDGDARNAVFDSPIAYYRACRKTVESAGGSNKLYKKLFLGPLPHALVCIEAIQRKAQVIKEEAKLKCSTDHQVYEETQEILTTMNRVRKEAISLQKILAPSSSFHQSGDADSLRGYVARLPVLMDKIGMDEFEKYKRDVQIALKGVTVAASRRQMN
ncbi:hypothetical protein BD410DRAFT_842137 [Rickenella mellea]|uniref:UvrD-like helicase ATP-binding domain-containing protein n=1 Tax=Rickenella mellea TaxID=50990 RepID=A0A4Y7PVJ2_9AGAM|nr:hypothetical protein BD410DRAFT_842137 [Rickenella mellea]